MTVTNTSRLDVKKFPALDDFRLIAVILVVANHTRSADGEFLWLLTVLRRVIFDGSFYHLWYLPALLLGTSIAYFLSRFKPQAAIPIAGALYLIGLSGESYYGLVSGIPVFSTFSAQLTSVDHSGVPDPSLVPRAGTGSGKGNRADRPAGRKHGCAFYPGPGIQLFAVADAIAAPAAPSCSDWTGLDRTGSGRSASQCPAAAIHTTGLCPYASSQGQCLWTRSGVGCERTEPPGYHGFLCCNRDGGGGTAAGWYQGGNPGAGLYPPGTVLYAAKIPFDTNSR